VLKVGFFKISAVNLLGRNVIKGKFLSTFHHCFFLKVRYHQMSLKRRIEVVEKIEPIRQSTTDTRITLQMILDNNDCRITSQKYRQWLRSYPKLKQAHLEDRHRMRSKSICNCMPIFVTLTSAQSSSFFNHIAEEGIKLSQTAAFQTRYKCDPICNFPNQEGDSGRYMTDVPRRLKFSKLLVQAMKSLFPQHKVNGIQILQSKSGLKKQHLHIDYNLSATTLCVKCNNKILSPQPRHLAQYGENSSMTYSFCIAFDDETVL
jgi:hypothetical protein